MPSASEPTAVSAISTTASKGESEADRTSSPGTAGTAMLDYEPGAKFIALVPFTQGQAHASARQLLFLVLGRDYPSRT